MKNEFLKVLGRKTNLAIVYRRFMHLPFVISSRHGDESCERPIEPIGHLGHRLRPPLVRGPPIILIYYIMLLSHLKKKNKKKIKKIKKK